MQQDADKAEFEGHNAEAGVARLRARKLFLRARDYGLQGLELSSPGISEKLKSMRGLTEAVAPLKKEDVPLVYWTAAAWSLAISNGKEDMGLVAELCDHVVVLAEGRNLTEGTFAEIKSDRRVQMAYLGQRA